MQNGNPVIRENQVTSYGQCTWLPSMDYAFAKYLLKIAVMALSLCIAVPAQAVTKEERQKTTATKKKPQRIKAKKTAPKPKAAVAPAKVQTPVLAAGVVAEAAAMPSVAVAPMRMETVTAASPAQSVNPYLAGWFAPTQVAALPGMAVTKLNGDAIWLRDTVTAIPGNVIGSLPSIKTVHPTGGRDLVVVNFKCPAEVMTGQYFAPTNLLRDSMNGMFAQLNESETLKFDIQLVCN